MHRDAVVVGTAICRIDFFTGTSSRIKEYIPTGSQLQFSNCNHLVYIDFYQLLENPGMNLVQMRTGVFDVTLEYYYASKNSFPKLYISSF